MEKDFVIDEDFIKDMLFEFFYSPLINLKYSMDLHRGIINYKFSFKGDDSNIYNIRKIYNRHLSKWKYSFKRNEIKIDKDEVVYLYALFNLEKQLNSHFINN